MRKVMIAILLGIGIGWAMIDSAAATVCTYVKQPEQEGDCTKSKPANVSINPSGASDEEMQVDTFTASCTKCTIVSKVRAADGSISGVSNMNGGGTASGKKKQRWVWNGPAQDAPGATYDIHYNGDGDVSVSGNASVGFCLSPSASAASDGTSQGSGSATGATSVAAELATVGGSTTATGQGQLSGSASAEPKKAGISASVAGGNTNTGSYARTGVWGINYNAPGDINAGATTILVTTKVKCITETTASAVGCIAGTSVAYAEANSNAEMDADLINLVLK